MDPQAQKQAIVDKLTGAPPETLPPLSAFRQPWFTIYRQVRRAESLEEAGLLIARAALGLDNWSQLVDQLLEMLPPEQAFGVYPSLHEISERFSHVDWLWPAWIPRGMVTLLGAAPGAGKSLVALDLARRVIHGLPFPDGAPPFSGGQDPHPGANVIIVDAEGAPALLNERAQAWDIDSRRLFLMQAPNRAGMIDLSHPHQQRTFHQMCRRLQPALVVIDSLGAATARGESSLHAARAIMGFLSAVARQERLALLVIHHLRKRPGRAASSPQSASPVQVAADDLRGSSHISAAARSVMALSLLGAPAAAPPQDLPDVTGPGPDPDGPPPTVAPPPSPGAQPPAGFLPAPGPASRFDGPRLLEIVKTNLCRHPPPLGLILEGDGLAIPTLRYTPYVEPAPQPSRTGLCAGWLFHHLQAAGGPVKPAGVVDAAREAGYNRRMVYRARKILGGLVADLGKSPYDPQKRWALATHHDPEDFHNP